jgi:hypothetical protein
MYSIFSHPENFLQSLQHTHITLPKPCTYKDKPYLSILLWIHHVQPNKTIRTNPILPKATKDKPYASRIEEDEPYLSKPNMYLTSVYSITPLYYIYNITSWNSTTIYIMKNLAFSKTANTTLVSQNKHKLTKKYNHMHQIFLKITTTITPYCNKSEFPIPPEFDTGYQSQQQQQSLKLNVDAPLLTRGRECAASTPFIKGNKHCPGEGNI